LSGAKTEQQTYHHGNLRAAAVEAALRAIDRDGRAGFSLRQIASELNVVHSALYRHFKDRETLLAAVAEDAFARLLASHVAAREAAGANPTSRLKAVCRNQVTFALENMAVYRLMFGPEVLPHRHPGTALHRASQSVLELAIDLVGRCQCAGELAGDDPMLGGLVFWSAMHGVASLAIDDRLTPKLSDERSLGNLVELTISGMVLGLKQVQPWRDSR
jgi:AcrR family transcriptional regulator